MLEKFAYVVTANSYSYIHINLFLHQLLFSKIKVNLAIHHSHNALITITKIKIFLKISHNTTASFSIENYKPLKPRVKWQGVSMIRGASISKY